jgi:hypothetical protein
MTFLEVIWGCSKEVYPGIKEANLNAKLILGGLLLACHPDKLIIHPVRLILKEY